MFQEILVVDYITDFKSLTQNQIDTILQGVVNSHFFENCPPGTIIGISIGERFDAQKRVYFPFFSHINMPIKAGERAWAFEQSYGLAPYWLTKKVQNNSAEDLNFTHDGRADFLYALRDASPLDYRQKNSSIFYDSKTSGSSLNEVRKNSVSRSEFKGEPVVSVKSRSIDLTLQGSNGTAIKFSCDNNPGTGTIDIVAGVSTTSSQQTVTNSEGYQEVVKPILASDSGAATAGNLSPDDDSRIIVSRGFNADSYYNLTGDNAGETSTVSIAADSVRILARDDLKIVVGQGSDPSSIILKSNGDIVITPSSTGIIKLGGEDATGALIASNTGTNVNGTVVSAPIISTAGGLLGAPNLSDTGVFATKILVKV
jgi:hypothetical protein